MLVLIGTALVIYWIIKAFGQNAGAIAIGIVGVLLLIALGIAFRDGTKAYANVVKYWKDGGPDRK